MKPSCTKPLGRKDGGGKLACYGKQRGQVVILFVLLTVAFVLLVGFVVNTHQQTSRKIEMQGAVDAAGMSGGLWVARSMNLTTFNNKGMADVLSLMITAHALNQTAEQMGSIVAAAAAEMAAAGVVVPALEVVAQQLAKEAAFYGTLSAEMSAVDSQLSGTNDAIGWRLMRDLDSVNQTIKSNTWLAVEAAAIEAARQNGADAAPHAVLVGSLGRPKPSLPLGRGGKEYIAKQAGDCTLPALSWPTMKLVEEACSVETFSPCLTPLLAKGIFDDLVHQNVTHLSGNVGRPVVRRVGPADIGALTTSDGKTVQQLLDDYNQSLKDTGSTKRRRSTDELFKSAAVQLWPPLDWPDNPPYPMMLASAADPGGGWLIPDVYAPLDLQGVRRSLQLLAIATGHRPKAAMGEGRFVSPSLYSITYGQVEIYNPTDWSMFNQDWRVRLARASLLEEDWQAVAELAGLGQAPRSGVDLSFINLH